MSPTTSERETDAERRERTSRLIAALSEDDASEEVAWEECERAQTRRIQRTPRWLRWIWFETSVGVW